MELVLRYLCVIILLQSVSCVEDDDMVLSMLNHISLSLARIARKQRLMDKRIDSLAANIKNQELRNLVESMSVNIGSRTADDLGVRIQSMEKDITAVEETSDDFGVRIQSMEKGITAVEETSDGLGDKIQSMEKGITAVEKTSDDLGDKIQAIEKGITAVEETSDDLGDRIQAMEKGITAVEAISDGVRTRLDTMETSIASLESAAGRHVSFSVRYKPSGNFAILKKVTTIKFNHVIYNDGSGYDETTGIFTVPVSGVYQIIFFVEGWSKNEDFSCCAALVGLYVDNAFQTSALADPQHKEQSIQSGNAYINYLNKDQKVKVSTYINNLTPDCIEHSIFAYRTTFNGVLLY